jgi:hypothetical protein
MESVLKMPSKNYHRQAESFNDGKANLFKRQARCLIIETSLRSVQLLRCKITTEPENGLNAL